MKYKFKGTIENLKELGFTKDLDAIYPKKMQRGNVRIGISPPCINVWDLEDKNDSMVFSKTVRRDNIRSFYTYDVKEDIADIIDMCEISD